MIRKITSVLLAIVVIILTFSGCSESGSEEYDNSSYSYVDNTDYEKGSNSWPRLYIKDVTVSETAKEATVYVYVINNPGISGALLRFSFDDRITLIDSQPGKAFSELYYTNPGQYSNPCNFSWDSEDEVSEKDGTILALKFKLPNELHKGMSFEIKCSFRDGDIYDKELNDVEISAESGKIIIE